MLRRTLRASLVRQGLVLVALALLLSFPGVLAGGVVDKGGTPPAPVRIGLVGTLFREIPEPMIHASMQLFQVLMKAQTGLQGDLRSAGDATGLGEALAKDQVQLGVFHGVEFAWARQKYPELRPLVIAINQHRYPRVHLVVRHDCPATDFAGLRGQTLALPRGSKEHCRLFLERQCLASGKDGSGFFTRITTPANVEDALDDVVDGVVQATVVDGLALDCYQRRKPGRFAKLKEVQKPDVFPAAVVAYHSGALDETLLQRFRTGMLTANQNLRGRQLLTLWKITGFEPIPDDYEQALATIVKAYPPPAAASK
jgi:ABC-type phosphate/phosphonate transport system substrate-binding protein